MPGHRWYQTSVIGVHRVSDSTPLTHDTIGSVPSHMNRQYQGAYSTDVGQQTAYQGQYPPNKSAHQSATMQQMSQRQYTNQDMAPVFPRSNDGNVPSHMRQAYETYMHKQREQQQMSRLGASDSSGIHTTYPRSMSTAPHSYSDTRTVPDPPNNKETC